MEKMKRLFSRLMKANLNVLIEVEENDMFRGIYVDYLVKEE